MAPQALIVDLLCDGIVLRVEGDRLIAAPASALTSADVDQIRAHKHALIEELATGAERRRTRHDCVSCGAELPPSSWARCPPCVDAAYRDRKARWAAEKETMP